MNLSDAYTVAYALYDAGFKPHFSTDVTDALVAGYGDLNYDFQYPLMLDTDNQIIAWPHVRARLLRADACEPGENEMADIYKREWL